MEYLKLIFGALLIGMTNPVLWALILGASIGIWLFAISCWAAFLAIRGGYRWARRLIANRRVRAEPQPA